MTLPGMQSELTNWTRSTRSTCLVYKTHSVEEITTALALARSQHLSVISHGAGHSYTDAALNTGGVVLDVTPMNRILSWDPDQGILRVEPGVTLRDVIRLTLKDGWWPVVSPSTPEVTIGGCAAMNINGRNAWNCGPFGSQVLALDVMLASGEVCTVTSQRDQDFFQALVGSLGLLGIITAVTFRLQRISSPYVTVRRRPASSLDEIFGLFGEEEQNGDFMEAWLDGFATGQQLGRGNLAIAAWANDARSLHSPIPSTAVPGRLETGLITLASGLARPALVPGVRLANRFNNWLGRRNHPRSEEQAIFPYTYWPPAAFAGYQAMFPEGAETFQAFVPEDRANTVFKQVLRYSQQRGALPLWCIVKKHRQDPFLLSYQVDGYSLELNYQRTRRTEEALKQTLQAMITLVIDAGGRFYLAKDHYQTRSQYRQSIGDEAVDAFLAFKQQVDPEMLLQSDLFRRIFQ